MSEIQNHFGDIILIRRMMVEVKKRTFIFYLYDTEHFLKKTQEKLSLRKREGNN